MSKENKPVNVENKPAEPVQAVENVVAPAAPVEVAAQEPPAPPQKPPEVTVTLFQDDKEYSRPVFVKVNGKALLIPRGVPVTIPREHYEALVASQKQAVVVGRYQEMLVQATDTKMTGDGQTLGGVKPPRPGKVRL